MELDSILKEVQRAKLQMRAMHLTKVHFRTKLLLKPGTEWVCRPESSNSYAVACQVWKRKWCLLTESGLKGWYILQKQCEVREAEIGPVV